MTRIYLQFQGLDEAQKNLILKKARVSDIASELNDLIRRLDWDIKNEAEIQRLGQYVSVKLKGEAADLNELGDFLAAAMEIYKKLESYDVYDPNSDQPAQGSAQSIILEKLLNLLTDPADIIRLINAAICPFYFLDGVDVLLDHFYDSDVLPVSYGAFLRFLSGNDGEAAKDSEGFKGSVSAKIGSASASGKVGVFKDGESIYAGIKGSAEVNAVEGSAGFSYDALSVEAQGALGHAGASAQAEIGLDSHGIDANLGGEFKVSAAQGSVSSSYKILDLIEIKGEATGYAGGAGIEGKIGIEDNDFIMKGGVIWGVGGEVGISIGFTDEVDSYLIMFIQSFWD